MCRATWPARARTRPPPRFKNRLNSGLTFDTLVEGTANRMARAAAMHVAGMPGHLYNPLFIYGGVGLGKTHLMHAVGNRLLADRPDAKVLYIHAEQFVSDVVKAYQRKTFDEFKERYHSLDLLLIDDVQFFANKDRTQEEFFNAFEALLAKKSHIVMTSDTYPKGLADIHERLVSRFDSGLTVAIEPPELEMRVAILINKARAESAEMPEEVAFFVAKNVRSNVRELEGALRKILAYSRFNQKEISIALAREALRDLLSIQNRQISVENIQKTVADYYKIKVADMYSQEAPGLDRPAAPDRDVPGQGTDPEEPARDRRAVRRPRPHHGAARGAQDLGRAPAAHRAQPAAARAGADAQGLRMSASQIHEACQRTTLGTVPAQAGSLSTGDGRSPKLFALARQHGSTAAHSQPARASACHKSGKSPCPQSSASLIYYY